MTPVAVHNKRPEADFISLPRAIYQNDPYWICPLEQELKNIFLPQTNSFFTHGQCTRWVLYNGHQKPIGRIAAFVNHKKTCGMRCTAPISFFRLISKMPISFLLYKPYGAAIAAACKWLRIL